MAAPTREEVVALYELLADGEWRNGQLVMQEIQRVIPPGIASRAAEVKNRDSYTLDELVRMGRRQRARDAISNGLKTGRMEVDVEGGMTRAHWAGDLPWQVRDTEAHLISVEQMADELDLTDHIIRNWITNEYIPHTTNRNNQLRFTPEQQEIVRKVAAIYPGPQKVRWPVDPRTLWAVKEAAVIVVCPHCDGKLTVTLGTAT